jgi:hypothetical protein
MTTDTLRAHFVELPGERSFKGPFVIMNDILFRSRAHKLLTGNYLTCIHSDTANRLFETISNSKAPCSGAEDVRRSQQIANLSWPGGAHNPIQMQEIKELNEAFTHHFKIWERHLVLALLPEQTQGPILGIHLRGRDKYREIVPPSNGQILMAIRSFLRSNPVSGIFLATDDVKYHKLLRRKFPALLLPNPRIPASRSRRPSHLGYSSDDKLLELDESATLDVIALSKCEYFMYSKSNLSYFSLIIGYGQHKITEPILTGQPTRFAHLTQRLLILLDQAEDVVGRLFLRVFPRPRK